MNDTLDRLSAGTFDVIASEAMNILNQLHFLRAEWFYAFIPLLLFLFLLRNRRQSSKNWHAVIDRQLMPYVLSTTEIRRRSYPLLLVFIAASLCITALAGPVYKKLPQPVYREQSSLVILLDLSASMNATDIKPSRLARARLKLLDILQARKSGQSALIVYAGDAFVVTPLTDDNATIANLVPALETGMMPAQGSNLAIALDRAVSLFTQSGIVNGNILVITDDIHQRDLQAIREAYASGFPVSIIGTGTEQGAPVPLEDDKAGGFLLDSNGAIVIPRLDASKLQEYALQGGGIYSNLQVDDSDVARLGHLFESRQVSHDSGDDNLHADIWQEEGHWLLLPLLLFAALWARKGWLAAILPFAPALMLTLILPLPRPAHADSADLATDTGQSATINSRHLWSTPDQKAMRYFDAGDNEKAAALFTRPEWKASAYYKAGDYAAAASTLESTAEDSLNSDAYYNKANALARLGNYEAAVSAYDKALELNEKNADARYNREQVMQALAQQQQQNNSEQSDDQPNQSRDRQSQDNPQDQQVQQNQAGAEQQQSQQQDEQQQGQDSNQSANEQQSPQQEQQAGSPQSEQQKNAEEQQLKQRDAQQEAKKEQQERQQYEQQNQAQQQSDSVENRESDEKPAEIEINPAEASITEEEKATEQWLKRIPDDPGGLLRRKFLYQYSQMTDHRDHDEPW